MEKFSQSARHLNYVRNLPSASFLWRGQELNLRALSAAEDAMIMGIFPAPEPPMVVEFGHRQLVPDERDRGFLFQQETHRTRVSAAEVAISLEIQFEGRSLSDLLNPAELVFGNLGDRHATVENFDCFIKTVLDLLETWTWEEITNASSHIRDLTDRHEWSRSHYAYEQQKISPGKGRSTRSSSKKTRPDVDQSAESSAFGRDVGSSSNSISAA